MLWLFKLILLSSVATLVYVAVARLSTVLLQRAVFLGLGLVLSVFIVEPDLSTRAARLFGIGRGVDLVFYLAHVTEAYLLLVLYARHQRATAALTDLARRQALATARAP